MLKKFLVYLQYLLPQFFLSALMGRLAESPRPWLKNMLIHGFIKQYHVDLQDAVISDPNVYTTFNEFFTRRLKPNVRPLAHSEVIIPVDGVLTEFGLIKQQKLLQAKGHYFDLSTLLANHPLQHEFIDGHYATFYLAPPDYHRVHMPIAGELIESIYVPGNLFAVNKMTASIIPNLYSRNERMVNLFATEIGTVAVILVGALIVGSIQMTWDYEAKRGKKILKQKLPVPLYLNKGSELGYFKVGSTVIVLFPMNKIKWNPDLYKNKSVQIGQFFGNRI